MIAEPVEADFETGIAVTDAAGFLCKWTDACGNGLEPAALGGTLAVSFLLSVEAERGQQRPKVPWPHCRRYRRRWNHRTGWLWSEWRRTGERSRSDRPRRRGNAATDGGLGIATLPGTPAAGADGAHGHRSELPQPEEVRSRWHDSRNRGRFRSNRRRGVCPATGATLGGLGIGDRWRNNRAGWAAIEPGGF